MMSQFNTHDKGFTLIELLIVMVIMLSTLTLTGALVISAADKAKARSERLNLQAYVDFRAQENLLLNRKLYFLFNENRMLVSSKYVAMDELEENQSAIIKDTYFDFISSPEEQRFTLSKNGFASQPSLSIVVRTLNTQLSLPWLNYVDSDAEDE